MIQLAKCKYFGYFPGMAQSRHSGCPVHFALEVFGDRWTLLVVRDMMFKGKKYYGEFLDSGEGIATNILADRLKKLESNGVIAKGADEKESAKQHYSLTRRGLDLLPVLVEIILWSARHDPHSVADKAFVRHAMRDRGALIRQELDRLRKEVGSVRKAARK